ncbi:unnamed protein product, partial [Ixodes persulcatus]
WDSYIVPVEAYFEGNVIVSGKIKRALLVSALDTHAIEVLRGSCAPRKVNELSYEEAVEFPEKHYAPKRNEIAESYKFFNRVQQQTESVREFVVQIRKLAENFNFGMSIDRVLRD